jgi:hypothetical protein
MQCVMGVVGKGRNDGPGQSKAMYTVRVLFLGGGCCFKVWVLLGGAGGLYDLGLWFGLLDEKVSGAEWS